jgi:hypothetical protein
VVLRQAQHAAIAGRHPRQQAAEDGDVGAPEPVDRLLGVSHRHQRGRRPGPPRPLGPAEKVDDLLLHRVHVLRLVDEQRAQP